MKSLPPGEAVWCLRTKNCPRKKEKPVIVSAARSIVGSYSEATSIKFDPHVSGGAYQNVRKVTTEWNARLKHCGPPKIRGSMHPASPSTLFSPIFSLAREKMGPPEARQKRPRRNESLQARLLILCARFFLSKPQTKFAVWVFSMQICSNPSVSLRLTAPLGGEPEENEPPQEFSCGVMVYRGDFLIFANARGYLGGVGFCLRMTTALWTASWMGYSYTRSMLPPS